MLVLKNIVKDYVTSDIVVHALRNVNLKFRRNEFVSIVGASGCGKTTTLNIVGGLDRYTSGDLIIEGISTKDYTDSDWDAYRNHRIGFVFQSYNLITHLDIFSNVELSLTLSGVSKSERKRLVLDALEKVGLKEYAYKKPNQLSGGQMQRVAIARALVNDPDIVLADEPTGALDSVTSVQVMDILKEIAKDKLVIMVTHNMPLAEAYSTRIITFKDGEVISDSDPYEEESKETDKKVPQKRTSMNFLTAIKLSFNNLKTKLGRTLITSIAGSIGIVGVACVLAVSSGFTNYIDGMQKDELSGFPIQINTQTILVEEIYENMSGMEGNHLPEFPDENKIYSYQPISMSQLIHTNPLSEEYTDYIKQNIEGTDLVSSVTYGYGLNINILNMNSEGNVYKVSNSSVGWQQLIGDEEFILSQYDLLRNGKYPTDSSEVLLVVDKYNRLTNSQIAALGYESKSEYSFDEIIGHEFKLVTNNDYYKYNSEKNIYEVNKDLDSMYNSPNSKTLKISGILRVKKDASSAFMDNGIVYTDELMTEMLSNAYESDVVIAQMKEENKEYNVLTGKPMTESSLKNQLISLGGSKIPTSINIYPVSFESKEAITTILDKYNLNEDGTKKPSKEQIVYTDLAASVTNAMSTMIDAIKIVLVVFASISLIVSSVMIGIITYVSVVERTKEIGVLRSLGARKKDIKRVFSAEVLIIGFAAGLIGVGFTYLISIPANQIVLNLAQIPNLAALKITDSITLVVISMILTFVAGLIPSNVAAKKDPVVALRTE
ncbi:MAG: ATP-binding cassette domain-containing protein [Bacilli bacterium]|nr:ATP-binding cassette domain-containing protein [Bacilli bacterium]